MCEEFEYCPLGLKDSCILEENIFSNEIGCTNFYYCSMQTRPWTLPYRYENRGEIMALIVICSYIDTGHFLSIYYKDAIHLAVTEYGWAVAVAIPSITEDDLDELPW